VTDAEPRTADPPDDFDIYELVVLRRPAHLPPIDDAAAELLRRQHLGHFATAESVHEVRALQRRVPATLPLVHHVEAAC
jgi:hypothetical protein